MHFYRPFLSSIKSNCSIYVIEDAGKTPSSSEVQQLRAQLVEFQTKSMCELDLRDSGKDLLRLGHPQSPTRTIMRHIQRGELCDITVRVHGREFLCHNIVLFIYSKRMQRHVGKIMATTDSPNITARGFGLLYTWMITDGATLHAGDVIETMQAALFMEVHPLLEQCWNVLDSRLFNEFSAFSVLYESRRAHELIELHELMANRISKATLMIFSSREFLCLSELQVCNLLKSNNLAVNAEMERSLWFIIGTIRRTHLARSHVATASQEHNDCDATHPIRLLGTHLTVQVQDQRRV
ncbi:kelch repeat and BTB domain-containing protein 8 isoform X2 [Scaptodrosophila lebanonensis]|uniref:Kelch repeat and BTB domain-containing protein 8 isoform X2 n=1 Tax=Drosophila lebanonensis TaxID=7225 RepID=A0A6J2TLK8_DROLE|nr:kelch repeat and BTB domain-containing protein 8 isoform X2 [Scaptodrosophila lebanonensis]